MFRVYFHILAMKLAHSCGYDVIVLSLLTPCSACSFNEGHNFTCKCCTTAIKWQPHYEQQNLYRVGAQVMHDHI